MSPAEAREALGRELAAAGLSATERNRLLAVADEYAAAAIDAHARTPRSQGGAGRDAA